MGSGLVGDPSSHINGSDLTVAPFIKYSDIFTKNFPTYLSIGMTPEQYWEQDCWLTKYYREAYLLKQEREIKDMNYKCWLQGLYFYEALCDVAPILNAFAAKGTSTKKYVSEPYPLTQEEIENQKENERVERMNNIKQQFINSVKKK